MTAPKLRRWKCPRCDSGLNAPGRMRRDDVRRFCLPCSTSTGRLVERTCPALDRERAARTERTTERRASTERRARAQARAERERRDAARAREVERSETAALAKRTVAGVDLDVEAVRLWNLDTFRNARRRRDRDLPPIEYRRTQQRWKSHTSGSYGWGRGIVVTIGVGFDGGAIETLLHELCHAAVGLSHHHDDFFWQTLRTAAREAWPTADFRFHEGTPNEQGWKLDERIGHGIQRVLDAREPGV